MKPAFAFLCFMAITLALLPMAAPPACAAEAWVPLPKLPKAKGEQCVAPVEEMRRFHMQYLTHQRDRTMRQGIRGEKFSLRQCVECHSSPDPEAGGEETVRPFCAGCHEFTAVRIDCFECHTAKREKKAAEK